MTAVQCSSVRCTIKRTRAQNWVASEWCRLVDHQLAVARAREVPACISHQVASAWETSLEPHARTHLRRCVRHIVGGDALGLCDLDLDPRLAVHVSRVTLDATRSDFLAFSCVIFFENISPLCFLSFSPLWSLSTSHHLHPEKIRWQKVTRVGVDGIPAVQAHAARETRGTKEYGNENDKDGKGKGEKKMTKRLSASRRTCGHCTKS